jgi:hypothetical protein
MIIIELHAAKKLVCSSSSRTYFVGGEVLAVGSEAFISSPSFLFPSFIFPSLSINPDDSTPSFLFS